MDFAPSLGEPAGMSHAPATLPLVVALGTALFWVGAPLVARADSANEPPEGAEDCTIDKQCQEGFRACPEIGCFVDQECPDSISTCYADDATCIELATAAGLTERCRRGASALYCDPAETVSPNPAQACRDQAVADGLEERCTTVDFEALFCPADAGEESASEDDDGCNVRGKRGGSGSGFGVALGVFVAAAGVTAWRARSRTRSPRRG
jgi:hypothetical protein